MKNIAYIDGKAYPCKPGERLITFLSRHLGKGQIPVLCHEKNLVPIGACRLCSVEVALSDDGPLRIQAACHNPVDSGMRIYPHTPRIERLRRNLLELLLTDYPKQRLMPAEGEKPTPFQRLLKRYGLTESRFSPCKESSVPDNGHPYIRFDPAECVHCYRCIRACDEIQGEFVLAMQGRGSGNRVIPTTTGGFRDSDCVSCGRCVQSCPTNALSDIYRAKTRIAERRVRTVCTYCGVGCNLEVLVDGNTIRAIGVPKGAAVNRGHTCLKGRYAFGYYNHPERLRTPMIRGDGELRPATWEQALDHIALRLEEIREQQGPDAIGGISSARCTNEENFLMQKFMRVVIGTNNIDGCARVCHAPTAFGMQQTFGTGAATNSIDEINQTDCLLVIGANPTEAHPVTGARIRQAAMGGTPLIVVDPRVTDLARLATVHLQPRPGTNVALLNLLLFYILQQDLVDHRFVEERTEGFGEFRHSILGINPDRAEEVTGVERGLVREAARIYASAESAMAFHGLGVTEHYQGSRAVMLIAALAMITGNIGRTGVGVNPLRGQNNVQGAADMGVQPNLGAGYLDPGDPTVQAHYRKHYGQE
ncbi:MAG: molybdopterin-dependent oxidoreductase, partial [Gammaproteobacteria bacterium]|nr:molybdopterin-dependent oxidoreductase [Gammaproteobacteria bacterium]